MNATLVQRYQPGGDIYARSVEKYGSEAAQRLASAARTGGDPAVFALLAELRSGPARNESTFSAFVDQITTDPFDAPLDSANKGIGTVLGSAVKGVFSNPWVLLVVVAVIVYVFRKPLMPLLRGIVKR